MVQSTDVSADADYRLLTLVMSLASAAWAQLGKVPHPATNKIEKDLDQAHTTIEFIRMLKEKTADNLTPKEEEMLNNVLSDLELNFADEISKEKSQEPGAPEIIIPNGGKAPEIIRP